MLEGVSVISGTGFDRPPGWAALPCCDSLLGFINEQVIRQSLILQINRYGVDLGFLSVATHWVCDRSGMFFYKIEPKNPSVLVSMGEVQAPMVLNILEVFRGIQLNASFWGVLTEDDKVFIRRQLFGTS